SGGFGSFSSTASISSLRDSLSTLASAGRSRRQRSRRPAINSVVVCPPTSALRRASSNSSNTPSLKGRPRHRRANGALKVRRNRDNPRRQTERFAEGVFWSVAREESSSSAGGEEGGPGST